MSKRDSKISVLIIFVMILSAFGSTTTPVFSEANVSHGESTSKTQPKSVVLEEVVVNQDHHDDTGSDPDHCHFGHCHQCSHCHASPFLLGSHTSGSLNSTSNTISSLYLLVASSYMASLFRPPIS